MNRRFEDVVDIDYHELMRFKEDIDHDISIRSFSKKKKKD